MYDYVVDRVERTTPTVLSLTLRAASPHHCLLFQPGQYATIEFRSHGRPTASRCFSLASDPNTPDVIQFGIRVGGKYTTRLASIQPGERVKLRGPFGGFVLDRSTQKRVVFCAGGIGITPFLSMIKHVTSSQLDTHMSLLFSVRNQDDIPFRVELETLASQNPNFSLTYVVSESPTDKLTVAHVATGRLTSEILSKTSPAGPKNTHYFLCGPPPYMKATIENLKYLHVPPAQIITEAFSQGTGSGTRKVHGLQLNAYTLGTFGLIATTVTMLAQDIIKTVPGQFLPQKLSSEEHEESRTANSRQADLDSLIRGLKTDQNTNNPSPAVTAAQKERADADTNLATVSAQNSTPQATNTYSTPKSSASVASPTTTATSAPATPAPKPVPVCTTSASGVTTCQ